MADHDNKSEDGSSSQFADNLRDSARQVWLAGLGAMARAQQEGGKLFESLVREGASIQRELKPAAQERFARARERVADVSGRASERLERMFEDRVARALERLDVPLGSELDALRSRVEELERAVATLAPKAAARRRAPREDTQPTAGNGEDQ